MNRKLPRWPLIPVALSAMVSIWGGWVSLGALTGFGIVHLLPGIDGHVRVNLALTLPVSVEAYAAYALAAWLGPWQITAQARRFAMFSAIGALVLGALGQVSYHLLAASHARRAPDLVTVVVSCIPVVVVGFGAALHHLMTAEGDGADEKRVPAVPSMTTPIVAAIAARIAPRPSPRDVIPAHPETRPAGDPAMQPARRPAGATVDRPGAVTAGARLVTPAGIARVRRKGASNASDDEVKAAIRELLADGKPVTPYRIKTALKGSKGGIGEGRASKLLAEVQAEDRVVTPIGSRRTAEQ